MSLDYINEAFKSLDLLTEEVFRADAEGFKDLTDFMDSEDDTEEMISIIDMDAETEDDLQDSYVGKVIVDCNICHSHVFMNKDEIVLDTEGLVDIEKECPYCGDNNGFVIIGEIHEFKPEGEEVEVAEVETGDEPEVDAAIEPAEETEEIIEESLNEAAPRKYKPSTMRLLKMIGSPLADTKNESLTEEKNSEKLFRRFPELRRSVTESFKNVSLETEDERMTMTAEDNGKVTVTTEPIQEADSGEMLAPVSADTENEIINANAEIIDEEPAEEVEEPAIEEVPEEELDFDIEEVDEESMNELGESYLKRVYENVNSFKLTSCSTTPSQLVLEGLITFKSGTQKKTGFIFEAKDASKDGKVRFIGENAHLSRGRKSFTLVGSMNKNKLVCESFSYNYRAKNAEGKSTRIYGKITKK